MPKVTKCTGEGQGSCKRCNDKGKWNRNWMCFLNRIEGYEGCYCDECTKEILKEDCMEKPKRYKNVGMSVEDRIYDMICDCCDQDPVMCHSQGYCEYDKEEIVEDE